MNRNSAANGLRIVSVWRLLPCCLCLLGIGPWHPAMALPDDVKQVANISSQQHIYDMKTKTTTFYGDVVFLQGSLKINADELIYYGKESLNTKMSNRIIATGRPARFEQTPQRNSAPVTAIANRLEYSIPTETLFLIDRASIDQEGSSMTGSRIEYDVRRAKVKASGKAKGAKGDGRVRVIIPPKPKDTPNKDENK